MDIIIDTNNIFHRIYSAARTTGLIEDMAGRNRLISGVFDFAKHIISKHNYQRVWFSVDGESNWRAQLYDEYKGNRKIDNGFINSCIDEFCIRLQDKVNDCVVRIDNYESDDIIACLSKLNAEHGSSTMIVSSDSDLNQLVKFHGFDDPFVVQYDPDANKKCYYIDDHIKESLEDKKNDIFSDVYSHPLMDMMTNQHKIIDKFKKVIIKIVSGDSGDNIPSCYKSIKGKNLSFGEKRAEQLYVEYPTIKLLEEANLRLVASKIISITKSGEIGRIDEIVNNIIRNKKLIILDEHNIDNYSVLEQACYGFIKSSFPINLKDIYI